MVEARAAELGAPLTRLGDGLSGEVTGRDAQGLSLRLLDGGFEARARLPLLGAHQAANAALALACVRRAGLSDDRLSDVLPEALAEVRLPGRVEILGRQPWRVVGRSPHPRVCPGAGVGPGPVAPPPVASGPVLLRGKEVATLCRILAPGAAQVTLTRAEPRRSLAPEEVAAVVREVAPDARVRVVPNPHLALRAAREELGPEDLLCAAGSVYLAGIARRVLADDAPANRGGRLAAARVAGSRQDCEPRWPRIRP